MLATAPPRGGYNNTVLEFYTPIANGEYIRWVTVNPGGNWAIPSLVHIAAGLMKEGKYVPITHANWGQDAPDWSAATGGYNLRYWQNTTNTTRLYWTADAAYSEIYIGGIYWTDRPDIIVDKNELDQETIDYKSASSPFKSHSQDAGNYIAMQWHKLSFSVAQGDTIGFRRVTGQTGTATVGPLLVLKSTNGNGHFVNQHSCPSGYHATSRVFMDQSSSKGVSPAPSFSDTKNSTPTFWGTIQHVNPVSGYTGHYLTSPSISYVKYTDANPEGTTWTPTYCVQDVVNAIRITSTGNVKMFAGVPGGDPSPDVVVGTYAEHHVFSDSGYNYQWQIQFNSNAVSNGIKFREGYNAMLPLLAYNGFVKYKGGAVKVPASPNDGTPFFYDYSDSLIAYGGLLGKYQLEWIPLKERWWANAKNYLLYRTVPDVKFYHRASAQNTAVADGTLVYGGFQIKVGTSLLGGSRGIVKL